MNRDAFDVEQPDLLASNGKAIHDELAELLTGS
jgi:hypothetical protein